MSLALLARLFRLAGAFLTAAVFLTAVFFSALSAASTSARFALRLTTFRAMVEPWVKWDVTYPFACRAPNDSGFLVDCLPATTALVLPTQTARFAPHGRESTVRRRVANEATTQRPASRR